MSIIETWKQGRERIARQAGEQLNEIAEENLLVDGALDVACYVAEFHPDNYNQTTPFLRSLIDSTCRAYGRTGLPPRESATSFTGGQCVGSTYQVTFQFERYQGNTLAQTGERNFIRVPGAIQAVIGGYASDDPPVAIAKIVIDPDPPNKGITEIPLGGINDRIVITGVQVAVEDGQPDNCGNPPLSDRPDSGQVPKEGRCFSVEFDGEQIELCLNEETLPGSKFCFESENLIICISEEGISVEQKPDIDEIPFDEENFDEKDAECTPPEDIEAETNGEPPEGVTVCEGETEELKWLLTTITKFSDTSKIIAHKDPAQYRLLRWICGMEDS